MGRVRVQLVGSFLSMPDVGVLGFVSSAEVGGHAMALSEAIAFLNGHMPGAIQLDHRLQEEDQHPPVSDFGKRKA